MNEIKHKIAKLRVSVYMETEIGDFEKEFDSLSEAGKYIEEVTKKVYEIQ